MVAVSGGAKKAGGNTWQLADFCNWGEPPEEQDATLQDIFGLIKATANPPRKP